MSRQQDRGNARLSVAEAKDEIIKRLKAHQRTNTDIDRFLKQQETLCQENLPDMGEEGQAAYREVFWNQVLKGLPPTTPQEKPLSQRATKPIDSSHIDRNLLHSRDFEHL